ANVAVMAPPALALSAATIDFAIPVGGSDPPARTVTVSNSGDVAFAGITLGATAYGQGQPSGWLTVTASGATPPVTVTLTPRAVGLARGTYTAIVPVQAATATNTPQNIAVRFAIQLPASIAFSSSSVSLAAIPNESKSTSVNVTNGGDAALTGLSVTTTYAQGQNWLQATLSSTSAPATLNLVANSAALAVGTYNATVRVSSSVAGVAARDLPVQLVVSPGPSIQLTPASVSVNATNGTNATTQNVAIANGGGGTLSGLTLGTVTYGAGASNWLTAQLTGTTGPTSLSLTFASSNLASGTYTATVPVLSTVASNSPFNLPVTLVVGPPPVIALNPTAVTFSGWAGAAPQGPQAVQVTNSASSVSIPGLSVQISYGPGASGWLGTSFQGGSTATPATLLLQPTTTNLSGGSYSATDTVSSSMAGVAARTVSVQYNVLTWTVNVYPSLSSCAVGCHSSPNTVGNAQQVYNQLQPYFSVLQCRLLTTGSCVHPGKFAPATTFYQMLVGWMAAGSRFP
ncbi:MAG: hypothetical protein ACREMA_12740, partial [Longimicrobiales bacterium]